MKKIISSFGNQCLFALILGLFVGHYASSSLVAFITPFGDAFIQLLKMVIIPLTFATIVASFAKFDNISVIKQMGLRTLIWFVITALIAASVGVILGSLIHPGSGLNLSDAVSGYKPREIPSLSATFLDMLPGNLIAQIAAGKVIPLIIFAIFFGLGVTSLHEKGVVIRNFFEDFSQVMFKITRRVIRLSPYGIFALLVPVGAQYGLETLLPLSKFIIAIYSACIVQIIVYALLIAFVARKNPIKFFINFYPAMVTAFTTTSSLGTLPVTLDSLTKRVKISEKVASFVAPLGATMKMDGCGAIYPAIVCILTANIFGIDLSTYQYVLIIITAAVATIGTAGVPGTASIMATVVLSAVGLPLQGLALVIGIDKIIDMIRTMTNVTGSGVVATIIDSSIKDLK